MGQLLLVSGLGRHAIFSQAVEKFTVTVAGILGYWMDFVSTESGYYPSKTTLPHQEDCNYVCAFVDIALQRQRQLYNPVRYINHKQARRETSIFKCK